MATATDGQRAHDILLSYEPLSRHGACWYYVWQAYAAAGASTSMGSTPTAYQGWQNTQGKHPGDWNPPPGAAIWLGRRYDGNMDGDVFIAGQYDGDHAATDQPVYGQTGVTSIQARMNLCGREYLGWSDHVLDCPINMGGSQPTAGNQRQVGANPANQRPEPTTSSPASNQLAPYTVGTFDGWIHGENVQGQDVWFRGSYSGLWSWAGGFTDQGTHDLVDLNVTLAGNQRQAVADGANGRSEANTSAGVVTTIAPSGVGTFDGWKHGEAVESNDVWFHGAESGAWFWSGGFTDHGTHDLADMNATPPADTARTVGSPNTANIRELPYTSSPAIGSEDPGAVVEMDGFTHGDEVEGNDVWFRRSADDDWMWSGGFTSQATEGLTEVDPPNPPQPADEDNPRGLPEYEPVYPAAFQGLEAPLGFTDCEDPDTRTPRDTAGSDKHPVDPIIDRYIIHHTGTTADQMDYFSYCNDRSSCPTWYMRTDGSVSEMIRPAAKPASTGPDWNWRSVATETLDDSGSPDWEVTEAQLEAHAQIVAWLAEYDGTELDGVPVEFKIDRTHVISHQEALPGQTSCPGPFLQSHLDYIVARAEVIYAGNHPDPDPDPGDVFVVPRPMGLAIRALVNRAFPKKVADLSHLPHHNLPGNG